MDVQDIAKIHAQLKKDCPEGAQLNLAINFHEFGHEGFQWAVTLWNPNYHSVYGVGDTPEAAMEDATKKYNAPTVCPTCGK